MKTLFKFISLFLVGGIFSAPVAGEPLIYQLEPCCQLCPQARDPANYNTRFLKVVKTLVDGSDDWLFRTASDFRQNFGPDRQHLAQLKQLVHLLKAQEVALALFYIPTRGLLHPDKIVDAAGVGFDWELAKNNYLAALTGFAQAGIIVPDMQTLLAGAPADFYFRRDHHWSPEGARASAKILSDRIKAHPVYDSLPKVAFISRKSGMLRRNGQFQVAAKLLCGFDYPSQFVEAYTTERADSSADSLFGDETDPDVVLLGTSNSKSRQDFNFAGFLTEYLAVDIFNEAVEGGGFDGSILQYLQSSLFHEDKPKLIIWELPSYYDFNDTLFFRRARALTQNGCAEQKPLLSDSRSLKPGSNEILFNGGGEVKDLRGGNLIVDLTFDNPAFAELTLDVWYINGRKESLRMSNADSSGGSSRYVFELNSDADWNKLLYMSMDVHLDSQLPETLMPKRVEAKLCNRPY